MTPQLQAERAEALLQLPRISDAERDEKLFLQQGLAIAEKLTASTISFVHFINEREQTIELVSWSESTLNAYCEAAYTSHYPVSEAGIWVDALHQRQPLIINDYATYPHKKGLPPGHAALIRMVVVPVFEQQQVVMLLGLGNSPQPYTDEDLLSAQLIANELWNIACNRRRLQSLNETRDLLIRTQQMAHVGGWELEHSSGRLIWTDETYRIFEL
ncbi:MAG: GAF domain-containing protein, partial [Gammaproteobacteria bacterium]|nr:GAF domain-containing protein [Gammaproteobacteria bacterium]